MNITQERKDALNAIIRIELSPADYQPRIEKQLKDYSNKVAMPGFRKGKVPAGMVRKMYGKSILVDELNKLTSESLYSFIQEQKLDILGNPLPHAENDNALDFDNPGDIRLAFEIGLAPEIELEVSDKQSFNFYAPLIDDEFIQKEVDNYRERLGEYAEVDSAEANDVLHGVFTELEADGQVKEGGITKHADVHPADLKEGDAQFFVGLKKGESVQVDLNKVIGNTKVIAALLGISSEEAEALQSTFRFEIETIRRKAMAELNQEFFDKLFGKDVIFTEEELRNRIANDAAARFRKDSEARFFNEVVESLVKNAAFQLPDEFLKRWLSAQNEGKVEASDIEQNYENYARGIRWQLIENKLIRDNNIQVTREQAIDSVANDFMAYLGAVDANDEERLTQARSIAERMLTNEKEAQKVFDRLYNEALNQVFLTKFTVNRSELPFDAWVAKVSEPLN
jgi:trigger factor